MTSTALAFVRARLAEETPKTEREEAEHAFKVWLVEGLAPYGYLDDAFAPEILDAMMPIWKGHREPSEVSLAVARAAIAAGVDILEIDYATIPKEA